uniref:B box-type domain-containing protein n=1 Tax=Gadus morhua TaxID=8049 RepID=A0A8C5FHI6_GADMO
CRNRSLPPAPEPQQRERERERERLKNKHFDTLTDALKKEAEDLCDTHGERLKLFCMDHQKPICVICRDAKDHKKHQCVPINEAAEDNKVRHYFGLMYRPKVVLRMLSFPMLNRQSRQKRILKENSRNFTSFCVQRRLLASMD